MSSRSLSLEAAICAIRGESDLNVVRSAFDDHRLAYVVTLALGAHPIIRAVAALRCELFDLLDTRIIADPALHDAIMRMIGTDAGRRILASWTMVAPADWGLVHAATLMDAVQRNECSPWVAAALIGPCNRSAELLHSETDAAFAIQCWGKAFPDEPTAWMYAISAEHQDRLIDTAQRNPYLVARCIPWLPQDVAKQIANDVFLDVALESFTEASPTARSRHADLLKRLISRAQPANLDMLTRLACVIGLKNVWNRVHMLIRQSPDDAGRVVAAAPWDNLDETVRAAILECIDRSDICASVAAARGSGVSPRITFESAAAFFAALDQKVWDALSSTEQRRWRDALLAKDAHLAVRALGLRPDILARAAMNDNLIRAAKLCPHDDNVLRWTLLPVALRNLSLDAMHDLIAALPMPPSDPGAFFVIASGHPNPDIIAAVGAARCTNADLARVVVLQRCVDDSEPVDSRCAALRCVLRGQTWDNLKPMMNILDDHARAAMSPDLNALIERLALPNQQEQGRQALARLASLPFETVVPTCIALTRVMSENDADAARACADALRGHGDVFLAIVDALGDERLRAALLPLPEDAATANALRCCRCRRTPRQRMRCAVSRATTRSPHTAWRMHCMSGMGVPPSTRC